MTGKLTLALPLVSGFDDAGSVADMMTHHAAGSVIVADSKASASTRLRKSARRNKVASRCALPLAAWRSACCPLNARRSSGSIFLTLDAGWVAKAFESLKSAGRHYGDRTRVQWRPFRDHRR